MTGLDLENRLEDWVGTGLITDDQARAIREHETEAQAHQLPGWVEPVAYLGAALVSIAILLFGVQVWERLATWGRVGLAAVVTIVLLITGVALHRSAAAPAQRAASFTWFLSVWGVAATAALLLFEAAEIDPDWAIVATAASSLGAAIVLYLLARTSIQQVAMAVATAFFVSTWPAVLPLAETWMVSLTFLAVGVIWLLFAWAEVLTPASAGWVIGSLFAIAVGFASFDDDPLWSGIGIAASLALIWLSTRVGLRSLLGLGVLGLLTWIPTTVINVFEETIAVPVAILVTGVVTLTVVVAAVRLGRRAERRESEAGDRDD